MKDDIDSVRGLLDRLKDEKERELLKEVSCSKIRAFVGQQIGGLEGSHCWVIMLQLFNSQM